MVDLTETLASLYLAYRLACDAEVIAAAIAQNKVSECSASGTVTGALSGWDPTLIARRRYIKGIGEAAWRKEFQIACLALKIDPHRIARRLGKRGIEAAAQNDEGLITWRELVNWTMNELNESPCCTRLLASTR